MRCCQKVGKILWLGVLIKRICREAHESKDKAITGKEAAVTHFSWERGCLVFYGLYSGLVRLTLSWSQSDLVWHCVLWACLREQNNRASSQIFIFSPPLKRCVLTLRQILKSTPTPSEFLNTFRCFCEWVEQTFLWNIFLTSSLSPPSPYLPQPTPPRDTERLVCLVLISVRNSGRDQRINKEHMEKGMNMR